MLSPSWIVRRPKRIVQCSPSWRKTSCSNGGIGSGSVATAAIAPGAVLHPPPQRPLGRVHAAAPGVDRVAEVEAERLVRRADAGDGLANAVRDGLPDPLGPVRPRALPIPCARPRRTGLQNAGQFRDGKGPSGMAEQMAQILKPFRV